MDNETGYLVQPNDKIALAEAISKLVDDSVLRNQFGEKGHNRVVQEFSLEKHVQQFEAAFVKLSK